MRAPAIVAILALGGTSGLAQLPAPPFEGLDHVKGVYTTIDGYGISLRHMARVWSVRLPNDSEAAWTADDNTGRAPYVEITCRAAGGYSDPKPLRATWTIPVQEDFPKRLRRHVRRKRKVLWPEPFTGDLDLALSAVAEGQGVVFTRRRGSDRVEWSLRFWWDFKVAKVAKLMAEHCKGP